MAKLWSWRPIIYFEANTCKCARCPRTPGRQWRRDYFLVSLFTWTFFVPHRRMTDLGSLQSIYRPIYLGKFHYTTVRCWSHVRVSLKRILKHKEVVLKSCQVLKWPSKHNFRRNINSFYNSDDTWNSSYRNLANKVYFLNLDHVRSTRRFSFFCQRNTGPYLCVFRGTFSLH